MFPPSVQPPVHPTAAVLLREAVRRLAAIDAGNPRLEAEYLLAAALGCERIDLFRRGAAEVVSLEAIAAFESLLGRRLAREPLQYVLGTLPFCGCDLVIGRGALIPRGETEVLVEEVAKRLTADPSPGVAAEPLPRRGARPLPHGTGRPPVLIDVGTGSGAILAALLARLPGWRGVGIDRSTEALRWAMRNLWRREVSGDPEAEGVAAQRTPVGDAETSGHAPILVRGDFLAAVRDGAAAAIVSNPPYIRSAEIAALAPEIRDHEPVEALDGGEDGLDPVRRLVPEAARALGPGGLLALELAPDQPALAAAIAAATGRFAEPEVFLDLAGRPRGLIVRRR